MTIKFETLDDLKKYLQEDDEGKLIAEELKQPLVKKRDDLLSELKTARGRLSDLPENLDELKEASTKVKSYEEKIAELQKQINSSNPDEKLEQLKQSYEEKLESMNQRHSQFVKSYADSTVSSKITESIRKEKGIPELLSHVVRQRVKETVDDNGNVKVEVLSADGKPLFIDGKEATIDDVVRELKTHDNFARAFEPSGNSGTGGRGNTGFAGKGTDVITDPTKEGFSFSKLQEHMKRTATG